MLDVEHAGQAERRTTQVRMLEGVADLLASQPHLTLGPPETLEELLTGTGALGVTGLDRAHRLLLDC